MLDEDAGAREAHLAPWRVASRRDLDPTMFAVGDGLVAGFKQTVVRGYAGLSLWDWQTLPRFRDPRYTDYARADASIGINGVVLNNVDTKQESYYEYYGNYSEHGQEASAHGD